jgi:hypothetical protein
MHTVQESIPFFKTILATILAHESDLLLSVIFSREMLGISLSLAESFLQSRADRNLPFSEV